MQGRREEEEERMETRGRRKREAREGTEEAHHVSTLNSYLGGLLKTGKC